MEYIYSPQTSESISLKMESSPVWEAILGIAGYTHTDLRHTFDLDERWAAEQKWMPASLVDRLEGIGKTNLWYGLIMLQNELSAVSVQDFLNRLTKMPSDLFYETLLPYKDRETERYRKAAAVRHQTAIENYASLFDDHPYLAGYVRELGGRSQKALCEIFIQVLNEWHEWVSGQEEWEKWNRALASEHKRHSSLNLVNPIEEIESITDGVKYIPEPSVWTVKLVPHISYRPWILKLRTAETQLLFYPLKDEYMSEPGHPSAGLIRGHKALGDEIRLRLLYQLLKGPLSLQEMSVRFHMSKTTLHHQLSLLKAAKFIRADKGIYSANPERVHLFSGRLSEYLGL